MKLHELFECDVINHSFGGKVKNDDIDIPKGYDRFEVESTDGSKVGKIVGIKGNKKTIISTGHIDLVKELVKLYNSGGYSNHSSLKPITMTQAFGSPEMAALEEEGIKLTEKPTYWEDFENGGYANKRNIHQVALKRVEKTIGKIKHYTGKDIYGSHRKPAGPLVSVINKPKENMCIIDFEDGTSYLVDTTQAKSYIRIWQKIV